MSYRISSLIIKNFKCIDDLAFNFENKELIVFDGPNGYGKTTIFDAIEIILIGKPRRITENSNILANYGYKESPIHKNNSLPIHLEISLKNDNKDILKIQRIFQPAPNQKSIRNNPQKIYENSQLSIFLNDVEMENDIEEESILNFHNIKNLFNVLNYVEQDENTFFLKKNPKDKYKSLISLLGIENELKQLNNLDSFLKTTKNKFEQLEGQKNRIEEEIKNLSSDNNSLEYKKLLIDVEKIWDKEKIEITSIDLKNSFLKELERVEFLFNNRSILNDVRYIVSVENIKRQGNFISDFIVFYWSLQNIEILDKENILRQSNLNKIKSNTDFIKAIENLDFNFLLKEKNIDKLKSIDEFKNDIDKYKTMMELIITLKESLTIENQILEELKKRRDLLIEFSRTEQVLKNVNIKDSECPTCGFDWESQENLLKKIKDTEDKVFKSYMENNQKLEDEKRNLKSLFLDKIKTYLLNDNKSVLESSTKLISQEKYDLVKEKETSSFKTSYIDFLSLFAKEEKDHILILVNHRIIDDITNVNDEIELVIERNTPIIDKELNIYQLNDDFESYFSRNIQNLNSLSKDSFSDKRKYIEYQYYNTVNEKINSLKTRIIKLSSAHEKVTKIRDVFDNSIKNYVINIIKTISIPFYIYTGKILQEHSLGTGLIFDADINNSEPQIKIRPINRQQEVSYTLSSGQLTATVISLMLVLNKVYNTSKFGTILIDDPLQTLDEINTHSLIEVLKYNFSNQQVIISTHEDRYSKFIRYKYEKFGLSQKNINMKQVI